MAEGSNKVLESRAQLLKDIEAREERISKATKNTALNQDLLNRYLEKQKGVQQELISQLKEINKTRLEGLSSAEQSNNSMGSMYSNLNSLETKRISSALELKNINDESLKGHQSSLNEIASINQKIAGLTSNDIAQRAELGSQYDEQVKNLTNMDASTQAQLANLVKQNGLAGDYAKMTQEQKDLLQGQHDVLDGIKNTINGTISTVKTLYGNITGAVGGLITGFGHVVGKIGEVNTELGTSFLQTDGVARKAGLLSLVFSDAVGNAKALSAELGDTGRATFEAQANIGLISMNMGISGQEAATLTGSFARLNGNSASVATDMIKTSSEFAKQNGIIPAQLMGDLANSAEEFALFGKDGGKNILEAAGYAAKLGVNMKTLSGVADGLLDFETSITKELELGAMLGKNINLAKARELAYNDDIKGAVSETLKQVGGISAFNKMDYYQKKQTADLLGVSVDEFKKMATNQEQAATLGGVMNEKFSAMGELVNGGLNKYLGTGLKGLGGMVTASGQLGMGFKSLGLDMGGMIKTSGQVVKNLVKMAASGVGNLLGGASGKLGSVASKIGDKIKGSGVAKKLSSFKDKATEGIGDKVKPPDTKAATKGGGAGKSLKELAGGLKAMGNAKVLFGAFNLIPTALGFVAIIAGLPGMLGVSLLGVGAGLGLKALGSGFKSMSKAFPGILALGLAALGFILMIPGSLGMLMMGLAAPIAAAGIFTLIPALIALGTAMASGVGALGLAALIGMGVGLGLSFALIGAGALMMGKGIQLAAQGFATLLPTLSTFMAGITLQQVALVGFFAYSLLGLGAALGVLAITSLFALPGLIGLGFATMLLGAGFSLLGMGMQSVGLGLSSIMTSLGGLVGIIGPVTMLSLALLGLSGALMGLGLSLAFLGLAGLPGMLMLAGISAISGPIIELASWFGIGGSGGESEAGAIEDGSLSEYETNMLAKMDQLIQATTSQRDIYLDKDKVTNIVMDRGERSAVNKFKLNRA